MRFDAFDAHGYVIITHDNDSRIVAELTQQEARELAAALLVAAESLARVERES